MPKRAKIHQTVTLREQVRRKLLALYRRQQVTATRIAEKTGLSVKWVQRYFKGERGELATIDELDTLCRYFNLRLADLLMDVSPDFELDADDEQWLWIGRQLTTADREQLKQMASLLRRARAGRRPRLDDGPPQ